MLEIGEDCFDSCIFCFVFFNFLDLDRTSNYRLS